MGSILGGIGNKIKRLFSSGSSLIWAVGTKEVYSNIDVEKAISEGFDTNTAVYSIVMRDAQKFASIPRFVYKASAMEEKAYNEKNIIENDLSKLLNRPNEFEGQDAFLSKVRAFYKVTGEAFVWLNRGDVGHRFDDITQTLVDRTSEEYSKLPVLEMYVLPSDRVITIPDPYNIWGVIGYKLDLGGKEYPLRKEDIIHWKMPNLDFDPELRTHLRGKSPLSSGYKSMQQYNDATDASVRMYKNDGSKGVLFNETLDKMNPVQQSQVKSVVDTKINSNDVKGAVATLQGKWGYLALNTSIDMQLLEAKKLTWKEICFLLQVPYTQFDPDTNFANTEWQQKNWVTNTIIPDSKSFDGELNRVLLKAFKLENTGFIGSDFSELPEMQKDLGIMATALSTAWWISPNEKRKMMNEEPKADEIYDELWIPSGVQPSSMMTDANEMAKIEMQLQSERGRYQEDNL